MTGPVLDLEALRVTIIADAQSFVNEAQRMITTNDAMMKSIGRLNGMAASVTRVMGGLALGVDTLGQSFKNAKLGADAGAISRLGVNLKSLTDASIAKGLTDLASGLNQVGVANVSKTVETINSLMGALRPFNSNNNRVQAFTKATVDNLKELGAGLSGLKFSQTGLTYLAGLIDLLPKLSTALVGMEFSSKISKATLKSLDVLTTSLQRLSGISPAKITAIMDALGGSTATTGLAGKSKALTDIAASAQTAASAVAQMGAVTSSIAPTKYASERFTIRVRAQRDAAARVLAASMEPQSFIGPMPVVPSPVSFGSATLNTGLYGQPSSIAAAQTQAAAQASRFNNLRFVRGLQRDALAKELAKVVAQQRLEASMLRLDEVTRTRIPTVGDFLGRAFTSVKASVSGMFGSGVQSPYSVLTAETTKATVATAGAVAAKKAAGDAAVSAVPKVGRLSASMNMLGRSAIGARTSMGLTQLTIAGFAGFSLVQFAHFETGITRMLARMGDYQQRFRELTTDAVMSMAGRSITPVTDVSAGLGTLSAVGMNVPMALQALPIAENFAVASGMAMATATRHLTSVLSALGLASRDTSVYLENMTRLSDAFIRTSQLVDVSVEELSESFNARFAASLRQVNGSMEEGIGIIAAYAAANVRGGDAGNRASIVFQALEHAMIGHLHTWQALGITIQDSNGNMKPMADIIQMLEQRLAGLNPVVQRATLQAAGFESRVTQALYPLLGFSNLIRETENNLRSIGGTTESVAAMIRSSFGSQITILWNNLKNMAIDIGRVVAPAVGWLASGIRSVSQWFHSLNPEVQRFLVIGTAIAASGGLLGFLGAGALTILAPLGVALSVLGSILGSISLVGVALAPVMAILGAVLVIGTKNAFGGWENTWNAIYAVASRIPGPIGMAVRLMFDFQNTASEVRSDFTSIWDRIRAISGTTFGFFFNFSENMSILKDWFNADQVNNFAKSWAIVDTIMYNMQFNLGVVFGIIAEYVAWFGRNWGNLWTDAGTVTIRFGAGLVEAMSTVLTTLERLWNIFWNSTARSAIRSGMEQAGADFRRGLLTVFSSTEQGQTSILDAQTGLAGRTSFSRHGANELATAGRYGELTTPELSILQGYSVTSLATATAAREAANLETDLLVRARAIIETANRLRGVTAVHEQVTSALEIRRVLGDATRQLTTPGLAPPTFVTEPLPATRPEFRVLTNEIIPKAIAVRAAGMMGAIMGSDGAALMGAIGAGQRPIPTLQEQVPGLNTTGGVYRQQVGDGSNLVNTLPASRLAALLAGGTSMNPQMLATTIAAIKQPMPLQPLAIASMFGGIGPQSPFGALAAMVASEMMPAYRGSIIDRSAEGMELPVLPGGKHHGEKFEQMSFNRFMLGGPEVARMEQQVRAQGVENLLQNTNTLIQQGNSTQSQILNRPPPPAVAQ